MEQIHYYDSAGPEYISTGDVSSKPNLCILEIGNEYETMKKFYKQQKKKWFSMRLKSLKWQGGVGVAIFNRFKTVTIRVNSKSFSFSFVFLWGLCVFVIWCFCFSFEFQMNKPMLLVTKWNATTIMIVEKERQWVNSALD